MLLYLLICCHGLGLCQSAREGGGGRTFQKLRNLEVPKILLERGITLKRGRGVDVEMRSCHFFFTLQFNCIYSVCGEKVKFVLLHFDLHKILIQSLVLKHCVICIFLIHSDSVQKMPNALFI